MAKIVLVGQAPSRETDGRAPFSGRSGKRLSFLLGIEPERLAEVVELRNLFDRWPGKKGKGDRFMLNDARELARAMSFDGADVVVLVGRNVAAAFGLHYMGYFEPASLLYGDEDRGLLAYVIPHPSGINRWWNVARNAVAATAFLRSLVWEEGPDEEIPT